MPITNQVFPITFKTLIIPEDDTFQCFCKYLKNSPGPGKIKYEHFLYLLDFSRKETQELFIDNIEVFTSTEEPQLIVFGGISGCFLRW